jgi:spoIIIJ-associated protein
MEEITVKIKDKSKDLVELLGFAGEPIITKRDSVYFVNIITEDSPSFLIGRGGETLDALQHMLRILLFNDGLSYENMIVVDINGYRNKKTANIEKRVKEIAHKVRESGIEEILEPMNSFERRVIHMAITNIADVESESVGERHDRRVKIKPKKSK